MPCLQIKSQKQTERVISRERHRDGEGEELETKWKRDLEKKRKGVLKNRVGTQIDRLRDKEKRSQKQGKVNK